MSSTDITIPNTAGTYFGISAYKVVSMTATSSVIADIGATFDSHPRSFTQIRFQIWNPILLFCCLGTVSSSIRCFDSLVLSLVSWLTGWNSAFKLSVQGYPFFTIGQESLSLSRHKYCINFYPTNQLLETKILPSFSSPANLRCNGSLQGGGR